jgi:hypothetical protein
VWFDGFDLDLGMALCHELLDGAYILNGTSTMTSTWPASIAFSNCVNR